MDMYGPVLAILMVIGGLDTRPRLGGLVQHEELGPGTVVKIEAKSKVIVLFHGRKANKSCNIGAVKAVSFQLFLRARADVCLDFKRRPIWLMNSLLKVTARARSHGVMVSTLDFESSDPSSSLGGTSFFMRIFINFASLKIVLLHI